MFYVVFGIGSLFLNRQSLGWMDQKKANVLLKNLSSLHLNEVGTVRLL